MPVPWATIEADPEFQALDADGQYDIASRWQEKMKAQLPTEEHDAFLEASNNRLAKYFAPKAIQAAQLSQSLLGGVTSPLGAATALASGELQVEQPKPLELAPAIPSIDQTMPPTVPTPAGLGPELAPIGGAGTVGELLTSAKEAVSTPVWQAFGVEKIPASAMLPGGQVVDLIFNSLGESKAAQVLQGLHKVETNQIENLMNFMGSPLGVATMGLGSLGPTAQRIASLAFAADMASSQPALWERFQKATTLREKTETLGDAVAGGLLTLTALKHGLTKAQKAAPAAPAEPPPLPSPTPLTDAALGETSTQLKPQQETPNATETQRIGQSVRPEPQGGTQGGATEEAGVGDSLQRSAAGEAAPEVVPTKEPAPVVPSGEAPVPQPAVEGQPVAITWDDVVAQAENYGGKEGVAKMLEKSLLTPEQRKEILDRIQPTQAPAAEGQAKGVTQPPREEAIPNVQEEVQGQAQVAPTLNISDKQLARSLFPKGEWEHWSDTFPDERGYIPTVTVFDYLKKVLGREGFANELRKRMEGEQDFSGTGFEGIQREDKARSILADVAKQIGIGKTEPLSRDNAGKVATSLIEGGLNRKGSIDAAAQLAGVSADDVRRVKKYLLKQGNDQLTINRQAEKIDRGWADEELGLKREAQPPMGVPSAAPQATSPAAVTPAEIVPSGKAFAPKAVELLKQADKDMAADPKVRGPNGKSHARQINEYASGRDPEVARATHGDVTVIVTQSGQQFAEHVNLPGFPVPIGNDVAIRWSPAIKTKYGVTKKQFDAMPLVQQAEIIAEHFASIKSGGSSPPIISYLAHQIAQTYFPKESLEYWNKRGFTWGDKGAYGKARAREWEDFLFSRGLDLSGAKIKNAPAPPAAVPPGEAPKPAAEVPKALVTIAKSATLNKTLPEELRQYSDSERADIAKAIGTEDASPEALSEALIERYAVNKTETPSPYPPGDTSEKPPSELDALIKADEGNDWTEATGPAEIPITPKPSRQAMGITPSGSSAIGKVLVAAKDLGKRIKQAVVDIAEFSDFRKSLLNWSARGQKSSDEIMRAYKEIKLSVPNPERREAITNWIQAGGDDALLASRAAASPNIARRRGYELARTLTPEEKAVAQKIRDTFDILRRRAEKYGIEINEIENYVTQIWKRPPREFWPSSGNRLSGAVRFAKARTFESFFAGEQAGWKPQTKDISKLLPIYMNEINNAINARQFVAELAGGVASDGRPLLAPSGIVKTIEEPDARRYLVLPEIKPSEAADYKRLDGHPALHSWRWRAADENGNPIFVYGDLAIHPEAFSHLRKVLGQSALREWWREPSETVLGQIPKSVAKFLIDDVQQVAKATMLGFFSPFHLVQEGTHGIGHKVNPFYNIPKIDMRDPGQMDAARHSLMLQPDRISAAHFKEGLDGHSRNLAAKLAGKIPGIGKYIENWSEQFQQWLFHQYIPGLKYKTYQHIYERNLKRYADQLTAGKVSDDQVKYLSAQQANAAYGHLNYADMGRNPTIQHIMQTFLLAPDFLEARGRFAAQAAKGLVAKSGREQAVAMATLAGTFWVAARILNQLADKDPHWDKPFEVVVGNRRYRMRSVPEDIYMAVKDTRSFSYGRLSPLIGRGTIEGFSGVNYRGEPTSFGETLTNIVGGMIPLSVQPMTRGLTETGKDNPVSPFEQFMGSIGLHVSRYSPVSETYKLAGKWLDKNAEAYGIDQRKGVYPRSKYVALRNALDDGDFDKAKAEIEKLKASEKVETYQLRQRFAESVNHPFTGSNKTDDIFRKSLDERGKAMFDSAKKRRGLLLERFDLAKELPR